ncbi:S66 peptidase family protein [Ruminococcus sp.]|uniref:S66 family peptidase n=1 Tax=Ruminococcus sp. TaxID=41978 RepID=UPI0025CBA027|nr:S66 peptidase family protein [Ruminococcus sp.]MBQ8965495.1 LD-carboxypeptidase [Ruminococcus sp.]
MKIGKGSVIGVFSPSWCIINEAPEAAARAEAYMREQGFEVKHGKLWGRKNAYRTGTPRERADEFNSLLRDPEVDVLMASVGGNVTNGMLPFIDYEYYKAHPKPVVGMSDVTSLLLALYAKTGIPDYYGTNFVTSYARLSPYRDIALKCFCDVLNFEESYTYQPPAAYSDELIDWSQPLTEEKHIPNELVTLCGGKVRGRLIGGNLWTMMSVWGTPYMPEIKQGDILFIEDTQSCAEWVESFLAQLDLCGVFQKLGGLIIGKPRDYSDSETAMSYCDFVYECIGRPSIPVLAQCDLSHCAPMLTIPIGLTAELNADARTITLLR